MFGYVLKQLKPSGCSILSCEKGIQSVSPDPEIKSGTIQIFCRYLNGPRIYCI